MSPADLTLIANARTDSDAFTTLFDRYRPLVNNTIKNYHMRDYSYDDWLQEARIALLKAVERYDGSRGSQFGPYYKMVLNSHLRSLLQRYLAQKRTADVTSDATATENLDAVMPHLVARQVESGLVLRLEFSTFLGQLSPLETTAFHALLKAPTAEQPRAIRRAAERTHTKLLAFMADHR